MERAQPAIAVRVIRVEAAELAPAPIHVDAGPLRVRDEDADGRVLRQPCRQLVAGPGVSHVLSYRQPSFGA